MNSITIGKKNYTAPSGWAEMTNDALKAWLKILTKNVDRTHAFALATMLFYKIHPFTYFKMNNAQHVQLKNTLGFLAEGNHLTNWLLPTIKVGLFKKYYGPSNRLNTSTIQEFRFAEGYYLAYQKTKDKRFLNQLLSTLYRPKGENELKLDARVKVSQLLINVNAKKFKKLDDITVGAILFNYEGCRNYIFAKYPSIFKMGGNELKSNGLPDLEGIIKTVAGGKFGTFLQTENTALYIFLDHLDDEIEAAEKTKTA